MDTPLTAGPWPVHCGLPMWFSLTATGRRYGCFRCPHIIGDPTRRPEQPPAPQGER